LSKTSVLSLLLEERIPKILLERADIENEVICYVFVKKVLSLKLLLIFNSSLCRLEFREFRGKDLKQ
jgi:hypothetical protein